MLHTQWLNILEKHANNLALVYPDLKTCTFRELDQQAKSIASTASRNQDETLLAYADRPDFLATVLAGWKSNIPVILLETSSSKALPILSPLPAGTAIIKQTCGATGLERSLFLGADQILAEAHRNIEALGLIPSRKGIAAISLAHSYGFGCLALPLLLGGIPIEVLSSPMPMFIQQSLERNDPVFLPGVPTLWKTWWLTKSLKPSSISLALCAGSPLSLDLETDIWNDLHLKIHNFYGTSETGAIAFDPSSEPRTDSRLLGKVLPGVSVDLSQGNRIRVSSDAVALDADVCLAADEFTQASYLTMDIGDLENSHLYWDDHVGLSINVAGRKVSPTKVQRVCEAMPGVKKIEVQRIRSRDSERFEEVAVRAKLDQSTSIKDLKNWAYTKLESWEMPRHWELI
ncbi:AMP-binding protein [Rubritalea sp.]|uniref:AMP-binding protein n=1 Tax=Rubritalea sp. TaxID=2109375 RepID=UPI003EF17BF9